LVAIERDQYYAGSGPARVSVLGEGLPCFLQAARPSGFIGRAIPLLHPDLGLPPRVVDWTDEHVLTFLTRRGEDTVGDLFVGPGRAPEVQRADRSRGRVHARVRQVLTAARTELIEGGDRVFLESERFDRVGSHGRRLCDDASLSSADAECVALLDAFGALIANTDRHRRNVSLFDRREGRFELAPVHDMLPMLYAPVDGDVIEREFHPPRVRAETRAGQCRERVEHAAPRHLRSS
jgi:hypothetical protein